MYYLLVILLFLKPSIKKEDLPEQIGRGIIGGIVSFLVLYVFKFDHTLSFLLSMLWLPAIVQLIFYVISGEVNKDKKNKENRKYSVPIGMCLIVFMILSIAYNQVPYITGGAKNLAQMVPVEESTEKVSQINAEHVIVISPETAYYEMQKMIGTLPNPSAYEIGEIGITMTKDGALYVAPIEFDGFFRAFGSKEIPGVIYVSAEKQAEAKIINMPVGYAKSLVFGRDLERVLRKAKPEAILFQANVELDDAGNPYYIGSYGHYKYGRRGPIVDGIFLLDFKDGKITDYSKDKVPSWVEQIYPSDVAEVYNSYFGTLAKGLINKFFAKEGVHVPTQWSGDTSVEGLKVNSYEVSGVVDSNGRMKWFTDHTNTSNNSTTMTGYTLMDMRTGNMIYYKTAGYVNGKGAMNAVDKNLGANKANWAPVQPLFYNLFGYEAWVVPVINKTDGALVKVAIVAAQNSYVVLEDNKTLAIESFKNAIAYGKINDATNKNANSIKADKKYIIGKVSRINAVTENGNTIFYVKLAESENIYMVNKSAGIDIVLTKEEDTVEIEYLDIKDNNIVSTTKFKNNSIKK